MESFWTRRSKLCDEDMNAVVVCWTDLAVVDWSSFGFYSCTVVAFGVSFMCIVSIVDMDILTYDDNQLLRILSFNGWLFYYDNII